MGGQEIRCLFLLPVVGRKTALAMLMLEHGKPRRFGKAES